MSDFRQTKRKFVDKDRNKSLTQLNFKTNSGVLDDL